MEAEPGSDVGNMRILRPPVKPATTLGLFPGGFNPPTRAHRALAEAALKVVDAVLWVLPRNYPHKAWEGATPEQREQMLMTVTGSERRFGVAVSEGGLFDEIATEVRPSFPEPALYFLCGRDAAERVLTWKYGSADALDRMLRRWKLLVAPRAGLPAVPPAYDEFVRPLACGGYDEHSSSRVRELMAADADCRELVDEQILDLVHEIYGRTGNRSSHFTD